MHLYHSSVVDWHLGPASELRAPGSGQDRSLTLAARFGFLPIPSHDRQGVVWGNSFAAPSGSGLRLEQKTRYPWEGSVEISVTPAEAREFTMFLRIPAWSPGAAVTVNGQPWKGAVRAGEYLPLRRKWQAGDRIVLDLEAKPRLTAANPRVVGNASRVAVEFGPLVYVAEQLDQQGVPLVFDAALVADARPRATWKPDLLGGVVLIEHQGAVYQKPLAEEPLYQALAAAGARRTRPATLRLIPYYAFANRGPTEMQVWMRYELSAR